MMKGIGASSGIAIGKAKWKKHDAVVEKYRTGSDLEEVSKLETALLMAEKELELLEVTTKEKFGAHEAEIFGAHKLMLKDPEFIASIKSKLKKADITAAHAVSEAAADFIAIFESIEDAYLRERAADLKDVSGRLIRVLLGQKEMDFNEAGAIILAEDLTPSDTAKINPDLIEGFLTEIGGTTSHSAIMARTASIPAIVGLGDLSAIEEGTLIAFDGDTGEVYVNPTEGEIETLKQKKAAAESAAALLKAYKGKSTVTQTGKHVEIGCNIGRPEDLKYVLENDGEGVGLFRSEFLYMDRETMPTEEEQFEAYKTVLEGMAGKPVVIRTLDIGGDKNIPYFNIPKEENPFLGFRAIRYCLKNEEVFLIQMKALLRAGLYGNLKIMMPMISGVQEVRAAKILIERAKAELSAAQVAYSETYELGIMIEIPSAAICADLLAKEVDFFSIGTNDLIQYTIAVDRMNQDIADLYSPFHPAVLRLIHNVIRAGHDAGIWVGMCGEAAGNGEMIPVLLAMGLDEFSMSPTKVLRARAQMATLDESKLAEHLETLLSISEPVAMRQYVLDHLMK